MLEKGIPYNQVAEEIGECGTISLLRNQVLGGDISCSITKSYSLQLKSGLALKSEPTDLPIGDIWMGNALIKDATVKTIYSNFSDLKRVPDLGTALVCKLEPLEGERDLL